MSDPVTSSQKPGRYGLSAYRGALAFLALTFAATWLPAWLLRDFWRVESLPLASRILAYSALYLVLMGWQPVAAVLLVRRYLEPSRPLDAGLRSSRARFVFLAVLLPCVAMLAASFVELALAPSGEVLAASLLPATFWPGAMAAALVLTASALLYGQCLIEEVAWRGYFLVRAMEISGPRRGLVIHGLVWGVWYAPIVMLAAGGASGSFKKAAEFIVTCVLLGVLLGWLRLASRSIVPAVTANVTLSLGAGLPIVLSGSEVGTRGAVYFPAGWLPLLLITCWLAFTRQRSAIATPEPPRAALPPLREALH